jgi:hypothetical protein
MTAVSRLIPPYNPNQPLPDPEAILDVLQRELKRSMGGLVVPGSPRPYFMQYTLRRVHALRLRAAHGALVRSRESTQSTIWSDVRVGSHKFDNVIDGGLGDRSDDRESSDWIDAPDDLNLQALQIALWKLTQIKFDEALEDYYEHRKATVSEFLRDEVSSFARERPVVHKEPLHHEPFPRERWEKVLVELSRRFLEHPEVYDPSISLSAERVQRWLATSEGTAVVTEDVYIQLGVEGWVLTEDGVYVEGSRQLYLRAVDEVPERAHLERLVDDVLEELAVLRAADSPGAFVGPALLSGQAASTLFHEALGHRLEGERLIARGESKTFARKRGERILPRGIQVYDDPTLTHCGREPLWGHYRVDDEGVQSRRTTLVEDGVLKGFLQSRNPIPGSEHSNGHGRHDGVERPMARMGTLVVEGAPGAGESWDALRAKLVELAKAQGRHHPAGPRRRDDDLGLRLPGVQGLARRGLPGRRPDREGPPDPRRRADRHPAGRAAEGGRVRARPRDRPGLLLRRVGLDPGQRDRAAGAAGGARAAAEQHDRLPRPAAAAAVRRRRLARPQRRAADPRQAQEAAQLRRARARYLSTTSRGIPHSPARWSTARGGSLAARYREYDRIGPASSTAAFTAVRTSSSVHVAWRSRSNGGASAGAGAA